MSEKYPWLDFSDPVPIPGSARRLFIVDAYLCDLEGITGADIGFPQVTITRKGRHDTVIHYAVVCSPGEFPMVHDALMDYMMHLTPDERARMSMRQLRT